MLKKEGFAVEEFSRIAWNTNMFLSCLNTLIITTVSRGQLRDTDKAKLPSGKENIVYHGCCART